MNPHLNHYSFNNMDLNALKQELVPALIAFQKFRDATPDDQWDAFFDDYNNEFLLDSLTEIEDQLIKKLID